MELLVEYLGSSMFDVRFSMFGYRQKRTSENKHQTSLQSPNSPINHLSPIAGSWQYQPLQRA
jgi:hypothetical protein